MFILLNLILSAAFKNLKDIIANLKNRILFQCLVFFGLKKNPNRIYFFSFSTVENYFYSAVEKKRVERAGHLHFKRGRLTRISRVVSHLEMQLTRPLLKCEWCALSTLFFLNSWVKIILNIWEADKMNSHLFSLKAVAFRG